VPHVRPYEVVIIFDVGTDPPDIQAVVERATESISASGGNPGRIDRWGKRPFAYEVNHKREGYYVLLEFTAEPVTVSTLDRLLALADEVMRHKIIRQPEKKARPARTTTATSGAGSGGTSSGGGGRSGGRGPSSDRGPDRDRGTTSTEGGPASTEAAVASPAAQAG
jgi:small subunit ribosomal protein S6